MAQNYNIHLQYLEQRMEKKVLVGNIICVGTGRDLSVSRDAKLRDCKLCADKLRPVPTCVMPNFAMFIYLFSK